MKALVLIHTPTEGPGTIGSFLASEGARVETLQLHAGDRLPASVDGIDAIVSMGGPMNVHEDHLHPFLAEEAAFLAEAVRRGVRVLGVCLGAQMIARSCGAAVTRSPAPELGWSSVRVTEAGSRSRWLLGLPPTLEVLQWHGDMFHVPEGGELLATGDACPHQAFGKGNALGLQFHVEVDRGMLEEWFDGHPEQEGILRRHDEIREELAARAGVLYRNFFR